jgi:hypothetical protein
LGCVVLARVFQMELLRLYQIYLRPLLSGVNVQDE